MANVHLYDYPEKCTGIIQKRDKTNVKMESYAQQIQTKPKAISKANKHSIILQTEPPHMY